MSLLSCLLGNHPSKWLTDPKKLLIFMRIFLLILAFVEAKNKTSSCNFYEKMYSFVNKANEYLSEYETLTMTQKKYYQNLLHEILKKLSENRTYFIGGKWGQSWTLIEMYHFYQVVISSLRNDPSPGDIGIGQRYDLPAFSYSPSSDPLIREKIQKDLFGVNFDLPQKMFREFSVIFKPDTKPLNVQPPIVSKPFVNPSENWTHLGAAISALNLAYSLETRRESVRSPPACNDHTPVEMTPRKICTPSTPRTPSAPSTPRTPRSPGFSKWLLQALLSQDFLQFLQKQSQQSSSLQLKQMFNDWKLYHRLYTNKLVINQNPAAIFNFFQALNEYQVVKIALELYHEKPLDDWMDIRIVSQSNQEDQKRFYEYLKMMIDLEVWLCDNDVGKKEFSTECDGKLWRFDEFKEELYASNLPPPYIIGEQAPMA